MSTRFRPEQFKVRLQPIEWALANYYASRRKEDCEEMVGRLIAIYAKADTKFDANDFMAFVRGELGPVEPDRTMRDHVLREAVRYARNRHFSDEVTASLAVTAPAATKKMAP